jgi:hypothetical protein
MWPLPRQRNRGVEMSDLAKLTLRYIHEFNSFASGLPIDLRAGCRLALAARLIAGEYELIEE